MTRTARPPTYPLRLPASIKAEAERLAASDGTSLNQFVATAVAEKVAAMRTASYFVERKGRADWEAFDRLVVRPGGEPPRAGDEGPSRPAPSEPP
jgi:HicB family